MILRAAYSSPHLAYRVSVVMISSMYSALAVARKSQLSLAGRLSPCWMSATRPRMTCPLLPVSSPCCRLALFECLIFFFSTTATLTQTPFVCAHMTSVPVAGLGRETTQDHLGRTTRHDRGSTWSRVCSHECRHDRRHAYW